MAVGRGTGAPAQERTRRRARPTSRSVAPRSTPWRQTQPRPPGSSGPGKDRLTIGASDAHERHPRDAGEDALIGRGGREAAGHQARQGHRAAEGRHDARPGGRVADLLGDGLHGRTSREPQLDARILQDVAVPLRTGPVAGHDPGRAVHDEVAQGRGSGQPGTAPARRQKTLPAREWEAQPGREPGLVKGHHEVPVAEAERLAARIRGTPCHAGQDRRLGHRADGRHHGRPWQVGGRDGGFWAHVDRARHERQDGQGAPGRASAARPAPRLPSSRGPAAARARGRLARRPRPRSGRGPP